jgi:hypothetical protein
MPFVENPLSDAAMDAVLRGEPFDKLAVFGAAEAAWAKYRKRNWFIIERVGGYVVLNGQDHTLAAGKNLDTAYRAYCERYGPTPQTGRHILGFQLPA